MKRAKQRDSFLFESRESDTRLWYEGPASTAFRRCLCYKCRNSYPCADDIYYTIAFSETNIRVMYPGGFCVLPEYIRWSSSETELEWVSGFPKLEE